MSMYVEVSLLIFDNVLSLSCLVDGSIACYATHIRIIMLLGNSDQFGSLSFWRVRWEEKKTYGR